jgi:superfamily II DNA helicase RecQ
MGINKPDVRYVIHQSLPKSLTNYYQESGRAGRDGFVSECIMFFGYKDKNKIQQMIVKSRDDTGGYAKRSGNQANTQLQVGIILYVYVYIYVYIYTYV